MQAVVMAAVTSLASIVRSRLALQIEILALRHQLAVYQRAGRHPQLLTLVDIALGNIDLPTCTAGAANGDGQITIDEILTGVNHALNGCRVP